MELQRGKGRVLKVKGLAQNPGAKTKPGALEEENKMLCGWHIAGQKGKRKC